MPARIPWILRDHTENPVDEYLWDINPNGFSLPYRKTITYQNTSAPDGRTLIMEGRAEAQQIQFQGFVLEEAQFNELVRWFNKKTQLELTDDLSRVFWVYITSFETTRRRSTRYPWRHDYNGSLVVLDWAS